MPSVRFAPEESRYEIHADDGALAGFADVRERQGNVAFVHTEIADAYEGQGLASQLIAFALDDVRGRGLGVLPFCPFVRGHIAKHPDDYLDLVPADRRAAFEL